MVPDAVLGELEVAKPRVGLVDPTHLIEVERAGGLVGSDVAVGMVQLGEPSELGFDLVGTRLTNDAEHGEQILDEWVGSGGPFLVDEALVLAKDAVAVPVRGRNLVRGALDALFRRSPLRSEPVGPVAVLRRTIGAEGLLVEVDRDVVIGARANERLLACLTLPPTVHWPSPLPTWSTEDGRRGGKR
jgi:hypothetical protein